MVQVYIIIKQLNNLRILIDKFVIKDTMRQIMHEDLERKRFV